MEFLVRVEGEDELRSLREWLTDEPVVRRAELTGPPAAPGEQGTLFDVVQAVLGDGVSVAGLIVAIKQWQATRPGSSRAEVVMPDGAMLTVGSDEPDDVSAV